MGAGVPPFSHTTAATLVRSLVTQLQQRNHVVPVPLMDFLEDGRYSSLPLQIAIKESVELLGINDQLIEEALPHYIECHANSLGLRGSVTSWPRR